MIHKTSESLSKAWWVLVVFPALFTAWLVQQYGVDVPFWDEWTIATLLQQIDDRTITLGALFAQHNEHRMFVPRSLQLAAALSLGWWDTRVGMWLTQGLLVATLGGCTMLWRRSTLGCGPRHTVLPLALVSWILFSVAQHQNLFWGFQVCFHIPAACLLASTIVASSPAIALGPALAGVAALCAVATWSVFPGLLTWPLAAAAMLLTRGVPRRGTWFVWFAWGAFCACVIGLYFVRYQPPSTTPSVWLALSDPLMLLAGVAACVGGSLAIGAQPVRTAIITGAIITVTFVSLLAAVWRRRADESLRADAAPWIVMGSLGLLTAVAITVGRVGYGYGAVLESRYTAFTGWILVGIVMIAATLRDRVRTRVTIRMWASISVATLALIAAGIPHHLDSIRQGYSERRRSLAIYTFAEAAPLALPMLPPWVDWPTFRQRLVHIEQSGWRKTRPSAPIWSDDPQDRVSCGFGSVEFTMLVRTRIMAGGWAFLPTMNRPADAVLVTVGEERRITVVQPTLIGRGDIAERQRVASALVTGWTLEAEHPPPGKSMEFWALDVGAMRAYRLCPT